MFLGFVPLAKSAVSRPIEGPDGIFTTSRFTLRIVCCQVGVSQESESVGVLDVSYDYVLFYLLV